MSLTESDFNRAARSLGCEVAAIKAVAHVEARGDGFLSNGQPKILFEAHIFSRLTKRRFDRSHPRISSRRWNRSLYGKGGMNQHRRLAEAVELDRDAALQSCSWGRFQVMGFHWDELGYGKLQLFINDMYSSEAGHLQAFVRYIKHYGLMNQLRNKNWVAVANGYNGPAHAQNDYAGKMERAYRKFA